jgi:hypothetical protein
LTSAGDVENASRVLTPRTARPACADGIVFSKERRKVDAREESPGKSAVAARAAVFHCAFLMVHDIEA